MKSGYRTEWDYKNDMKNIDRAFRNNTGDSDPGQQNRSRTLFDAISRIEQLYVVESKSTNPLDGENFTISEVASFATISFRWGLLEITLMLAILFFTSLLQLHELFKTGVRSFTAVDTGFYTVVALTVVISFVYLYPTKFYVGKLTAKAIYSLFVGRMVAIMIAVSTVTLVFQPLYNSMLSDSQPLYAFSEWVFGHESLPGIIINNILPYDITPKMCFDGIYLLVYGLARHLPAIGIIAFIGGLFPFLPIAWKKYAMISRAKANAEEYERY